MLTYPQTANSLDLVVKSWRSYTAGRKAILLIAVLWCALHVGMIVAGALFAPEYTPEGMRGQADLVVYTDAADALRARQPLYSLSPWNTVQVYYYHPIFALVFSWFSSVPFRVLGVIGIVVQVLAYLASWLVWRRILRAFHWNAAADRLLDWLPVAITFSPWFANLLYWNITSTLLLLSGLLVLALVKERPVLAAVVALPILLVKPHWLFPLILPVVLRQWKLLLQVIAILLVAYVAISGIYVLFVGTDYGTQTLRDYATFLTRVEQNYPWEGQGPTFGHMNHSLQQTLLHYFGDQAWALQLGTAVKVLLIGLVGWQLVRAWRRRVGPGQTAIWFVWLAYLVAMALLGQLWELAAGIVIFVLLQFTEDQSIRRISLLFLPYAYFEIPALVGFATGFDGFVVARYVPHTLLALLLLFGLVIWVVHRQLFELDEKRNL
jgi:Glycosyltransferase family 87